MISGNAGNISASSKAIAIPQNTNQHCA